MFEVYKNKKVLLTGHTGFKGAWLALMLKELGADVLGYALEPPTQPSLFEILNLSKHMKSVIGDIRDKQLLEKTFEDFQPEFVFHLAAQPLVRFSYKEPVLTYETNVLGTLNVLEAARKCGSVKSFVNVTTDKCYENKETLTGYKENDPLGGYDMYSSSKGCVEIMSSSYRRCFLNEGQEGAFSMATVRAGNVIGGGDWGENRLIPDCVQSLKKGEEITIRNPDAARPWQFVLEPLSGYLILGEKLYKAGGAYAQGYNFGPAQESVLTVSEIVQKITQFWGEGTFKTYKEDDLHEAKLLVLNTEKAKKELGWISCYSADEAVEKTVSWYKRFYNNEEMSDFSREQIKDYMEIINGTIA